MSTKTIHVMQFHLVSNVNEEDFILLSNELHQNFWKTQEGFISRELWRGDNNFWVKLHRWESKDAVKNALRKAFIQPAFLSWMEMIDETNLKELHLDEFLVE